MTRYRHGMARSKVYGVWSAMIARCHNPNVKTFKNYGGRGITVCERWRTFDNFLADMGEPEPAMTLDRIENDQGYSPQNCRWATRVEQVLNRRCTKLYTVGGLAKPLSEWAALRGLSVGTLWARIKKGWPVEAAINTPKITQRAGIPQGAKLYEYGARHGVAWADDEREAA